MGEMIMFTEVLREPLPSLDPTSQNHFNILSMRSDMDHDRARFASSAEALGTWVVRCTWVRPHMESRCLMTNRRRTSSTNPISNSNVSTDAWSPSKQTTTLPQGSTTIPCP